MNILLIGSGGRECALAWKLAQSTHTRKLYIAPGNAGTSAYGTNIPVNDTDLEAIGEAALKYNIQLIIPGPEAPLAAGITDFFQQNEALSHIPVIGPSISGARLESSKEFAKAFMQRHGIPTATYRSFGVDDLTSALDYLNSLKPPLVIKADGLAAGKGVAICSNKASAIIEVKEMLLKRKFGQASERIVIEQFLSGIEMSAFVLTDGQNYVVLPEAKDYKRIGEGDTGLNTGGMGAVSPVAFADDVLKQKIEERIIRPTIYGLQKENIPYTGFIFFGLMICDNEPFVIEYNVRLGDPEAEVILPRIESDILELLIKAANKQLDSAKIVITPRSTAAVMMVSGGYPGNYSIGKLIDGAEDTVGNMIFHSATRRNENGELVTAGGRVMAITAYGATLNSALNLAYERVRQIHFENCYYRRDIGKDLLANEIS